MFWRKKDNLKSEKAKESEKRKEKKLSRFLVLGMGKDKEYFLENLSMLMASGMEVMLALEAIKKEVRTTAAKKVIDKLKEQIEEGYSLSEALISTRIFSDYAISLIKIGEKSGRLKENLKVIIDQEEKTRTFKSKIKSAMMYPLLILALSATIGIGIAWFILPRLANVFSQLDIKLPLITQALIATGEFLGDYGKIAIPVFLVVFISIFYFFFFFSKTKFIGQSILFFLPGSKRLIKETELARFGYLLGTLLEAGLPVVSALNSVANATPFGKYKKIYQHFGKEVKEGNSFRKCFKSFKKTEKLIPATVQQMIISGEKSGMLSEVLKKIGANYEEKTNNTTKNLTVILEPVMLVIVWLGVVAVALAVILPIYSLVGGLNEPKEISQNPPPVIKKTEAEEEKLLENEEENELETEELLPELRILETGLGYLNVRAEPSLKGEIVGEAMPGEKYFNVGQKEDWYQIIYGDPENEEKGWVFGEYVEFIEEEEEN